MKKDILIYILLFLVAWFGVLSCSQKAEASSSSTEYPKNYLTGVGLYQEGNYAEAFTVLKDGAEYPNPIQDYYLYYGGRAALKTKNYKTAKTYFTLLAKLHSNSQFHKQGLKYFSISKAAAEGFPENTKLFFYKGADASDKGMILDNAAYLAAYEGKTNLSKLYLKEGIEEYGDYSCAVLYDEYFYDDGAITNEESDDFLFKLCRLLYSAGRYRDFDKYISLFEKSRPDEYLYFKGMLLYKRGSFKQAAQLLESYVNKYSKRKSSALFNLANAHRRRYYYTPAIKYYAEYAKLYPSSWSSSTAYRRILQMYSRRGDYASMRPYIEKMYKNFRGAWHTEVYLRDYLRYQFHNDNKENTLAALEMLDGLMKNSSRRHYFRSWQIHIYRKYGMEKELKAALYDALTKNKDHFYLKEAIYYAPEKMLDELRKKNELYFKEARLRYNTNDPDGALETLNKIQFFDTVKDDIESDFLKDCRYFAKKIFMKKDFVRDFYSLTNENEIIERLRKIDLERTEKALMLYKVKDFANAHSEIRKIYLSNKNSYPVLYMLKKILFEMEDYGTYLHYCLNIHKMAEYPYKDNIDIIPVEFRKLIYPLYYSSIVYPEAEKSGADPFLMFAIMREESHFKRDAKSWAGAMGLMQLMPGTASWMNRVGKLGIKNLDLFNPKQNIQLGAEYIKYLMDEVDTRSYVISSGYNGGHNNAAKWKKRFGADDPFYYTRMITLQESERYVEKVMRSIHNYKRLYGEGSSAEKDYVPYY